MPTEECFEECEILTSIYSEISIEHDKPNTGESLITMILYPSTGDDETTRHVTVTLEFTLPPNYPNVLPNINFRNPRGVSETKLEELQVTVTKKSEDLMGSSMMFQIRDIVQEFLTTNNRPASECPICLLSFTDFDVFYRPSCYHHFHSKCLGTYLQNVVTTFNGAEQKLPGDTLVLRCPVCRMELAADTDVDKLVSAPSPAEESLEALEQTSLPDQWLGKREELQTLYLKQKQQGGIIDLTEKKKLLVISAPNSSSSGTTPASTASDSDSTTSEPTISIPIQSVNETATRKPTRSMSTETTAPTTLTTSKTTAHSQRGQSRPQSNLTGPPAHKEEGQGHANGQHSHGHAHGHHHNRFHRPHHYRGESRNLHAIHNHGGVETRQGESKQVRNPPQSTVNSTKEGTLTSESQQAQVTRGRGHGQGYNRERRRPK